MEMPLEISEYETSIIDTEVIHWTISKLQSQQGIQDFNLLCFFSRLRTTLVSDSR
jgi:hypothetical protein